jgi:hypothetical protein
MYLSCLCLIFVVWLYQWGRTCGRYWEDEKCLRNFCRTASRRRRPSWEVNTHINSRKMWCDVIVRIQLVLVTVQWQALMNLWISYKNLECFNQFSKFQLSENDGAPSSLTGTCQVMGRHGWSSRHVFTSVLVSEEKKEKNILESSEYLCDHLTAVTGLDWTWNSVVHLDTLCFLPAISQWTCLTCGWVRVCHPHSVREFFEQKNWLPDASTRLCWGIPNNAVNTSC